MSCGTSSISFQPRTGARRLEGLIVSADALVFCISPDSLHSEVVQWELEVAERLSKRIIPVVIRSFDEPVPATVARLNYIFMTCPDEWEDGLSKLTTSIGSDIDWVRDHTRIGELAQRWETNGRRRDDLLRGGSLEQAERWLEQQPREAPAPSPTQRAFIAAGRRNDIRRQRILITASLLVAVMALGLSAIALWQRSIAIEQRTQATARQLAAEAQVSLADPLAEPEVALRNLLISQSLSPSAAAQDALTRGTSRLPPRRLGDLPWPVDDLTPRRMTFGPEGTWLGVITTRDVIFWNLRTRKVALRHTLPESKGDPTLSFAEGAARALVSLLAKKGSDSRSSWLAIDLATHQIETLNADDTLDVIVDGSDILKLSRVGDAAEIVDPMTATVRHRVTAHGSSSLPVFGRIFRVPSEPTPMPGMMSTARDQTGTVLKVLLVDSEGVASVSPIDETGREQGFELPEGAVPLSADPAGRLLAFRHPEKGDSVMRIPGGKVIWQARENAGKFLDFAGGGRFIKVIDKAGLRLESITEAWASKPDMEGGRTGISPPRQTSRNTPRLSRWT